jgi:hypothetical protein
VILLQVNVSLEEPSPAAGCPLASPITREPPNGGT